MRRLLGTTLTLAVAAAACVRGPAPLEPVGTYSFETLYQGQFMTGTIVVDPGAAEGQYQGVVRPDNGPPPVPIIEVTVLEREMTIVGDAGGDELIIVLVFDEEGVTYTGSWVIGFDSGEMTGQRQPAER
jgi:hypothetical protein